MARRALPPGPAVRTLVDVSTGDDRTRPTGNTSHGPHPHHRPRHRPQGRPRHRPQHHPSPPRRGPRRERGVDGGGRGARGRRRPHGVLRRRAALPGRRRPARGEHAVDGGPGAQGAPGRRVVLHGGHDPGDRHPSPGLQDGTRHRCPPDDHRRRHSGEGRPTRRRAAARRGDLPRPDEGELPGPGGRGVPPRAGGRRGRRERLQHRHPRPRGRLDRRRPVVRRTRRPDRHRRAVGAARRTRRRAAQGPRRHRTRLSAGRRHPDPLRLRGPAQPRARPLRQEHAEHRGRLPRPHPAGADERPAPGGHTRPRAGAPLPVGGPRRPVRAGAAGAGPPRRGPARHVAGSPLVRGRGRAAGRLRARAGAPCPVAHRRGGRAGDRLRPLPAGRRRPPVRAHRRRSAGPRGLREADGARGGRRVSGSAVRT